MAVNKVAFGDAVVMDITDTTATEDKVAKDEVFYKANGERAIGTMENSSIPSYVVDEAKSTITKAFSHGNLGRTIRFIAVSDSHNDANNMASANPNISVSNKHCGQAIKYITDRIGLDFVAFLGDATWGGVADVSGAYNQQMIRNDIEQFNSFIADGYKGVPNVRLVGNHDQLYTSDSKRLWNSGAYDFFGRYCEGDKKISAGYGYFDLDSSKVRVIYLNTSDIPSASTAGTYLGVTQEQKNWLCETLIATNAKTDASDWKIIIMSHAPLDLLSGIATEILIAYTNGGTYGSYTFTDNDVPIISNVHGHVHCYSYGYINDKIRRFTIPNSNYQVNNHYRGREGYEKWVDDVTYPKTANSGDDTAFSLVTIDLDSNMAYVDNYGAGIDRVFSCDYYTPPVPTNLFVKTPSEETTGTAVTPEDKVYLGGRLNSSHKVVRFGADQLITRPIPCSVGDVFVVETDLDNKGNPYKGSIAFYDTNGNYLVEASSNYTWNWISWETGNLKGTYSIPSIVSGVSLQNVVYARFTVAYTDIDNIVITK